MGEVILALSYGSAYLQTQAGIEKHALVVIGDASTIESSDNIGAEQCNGLIGALLCRGQLLKGRISAVLSWGHPVIDEVLLSCPGTITFWVPRTVLIPQSSGIANEILFCKHHFDPSLG